MTKLARHIGAAIAIFFALMCAKTAPPTYAADLGSSDANAGFEQSFAEPLTDRYIRFDAGLGWYDEASFYQDDLHINGGSFVNEKLGTQGSVGVGIGWQLRSWLRFDLTGEYRIPSSISGYDNLTGTLVTGEHLQANTRYAGDLSAIVGLANIYVDLRKMGRITPYIGAGAGFARVEVSHLETSSYGTLTDPATGQHVGNSSEAFSANNSEWNFAWALMAGFAMDVSPDVKLDVGYRYIDLGSGSSAASDLLICVCGTIGQKLEMSDLQAHEVRVGLRIPFGNREEQAQPLK